MAYEAEISRANPTCFLFLIDQSGSMGDPFGSGESTKKKAEGVADAINRLLQTLTLRAAKEEGIRDYFHAGVIGYGAKVGTALGGSHSGRDLVPISEIANNPARIESRTRKVDDGAGGLIDQPIKFPVWFDPVANGGTPMCQALRQARDILSQWLTQHPNCFPPVVIHITDGESTDGEPIQAMQDITSLRSTDGDVLLFNFHLSGNPNAISISFPDSSTNLPDQYARLLFDGASFLTPAMRTVAKEHGFNLSDGSKGFVLNADLVLVIQAIDIGTRATNLR